jgi:hypothetical protein
MHGQIMMEEHTLVRGGTVKVKLIVICESFLGFLFKFLILPIDPSPGTHEAHKCK